MRRSIIGIASVAPVTEVSGQGRVIAQLLSGPEAGGAVVMSDRTDIATVSDVARSITFAKPRGRWAERLARRGYPRAADLMLIYETIKHRSVEIERAATGLRCDALVGCSGDPYDLAASALACRRLDIPFFAYAFDDPIDQWAMPHYGLAARIAARWWLPLARAIFVTNELLETVWRARGARTVLVRNPIAYDESAAPPDGRASQHRAPFAADRSKVSLIYTGSVYHAQADAFRNLIAAMDQLGGRFHLHVFSEQSAERAASFGVSGPHVSHHDSVPAAEIPCILASADILFLPLGFDTGVPGVIRTASPGKLGDYLAAGKPILAHVPPGCFVAEFCRGHACAEAVDRPDPSALVDALTFLARGGPAVEQLCVQARASAAEFSAPRVREIFWSTIDEVLAAEPKTGRGDRRAKRRSALGSAAAWLASAPAILRGTGFAGAAKIAASPAFDRDYYRFDNVSAPAARASQLAHFLARGAAEGRESNRLFDRAFYMRSAGEAARANPFLHYLQRGWQRGLDPGPFFSVSEYLAASPDLRESGAEPLGHYTRTGAAEGRKPFARFALPQPLSVPAAPREAKDVTFSVIVPTYNHAHYLPQALDSLRGQNFANWEAIVVDDGSTDDTPTIVADYERRDPRIIGVRKTNGGIASALNEGLRHARTDWLMWLSADDLFHADRMAVAARWIERFPHVGLFYSDYAVLHDATGRIDDPAHAIPEGVPSAPLWQSLAMLHANLVEGITVTFQRRLADALGGFRQDLRYAQDYDFWLRASRRVPIAFIPESLAVSRSYGGQTTVVRQRAAEIEALKVLRAFTGEHPLHALVGGLDPHNVDQLFCATRWALELAARPTGMFVRNGDEQALLAWLAASVAPAQGDDYRRRLEAEIKMRRSWRGSDARVVQLEQLLKMTSDRSASLREPGPRAEKFEKA